MLHSVFAAAQQNLDMIIHSLVARWQDLYEEQWKEAKIKIDIEADEYKQSIIEKLDIKL
ncbi:hypothetical protein [Pseudomonas fragi]|uniref:Uncharacterized protein n=1 Tax=Pseudomonas fragi TaxID=296 RepID=A0A9Q5B8V9_PSEFR|nr:hypothetical protein [Pseudomonas fragi]NNB52168.1 hypothetical protein [Pseudomonas fragi]